MKAAVFHGVGEIRLDRKSVPIAHAGEALIRVTLTTICGTDLHILRGEYPVEKGLTIGHEAVGVIEELGDGVHGFPCGRARARRRHHAVRPVPRLPLGALVAVRRRRRLRGARRLALRQHASTARRPSTCAFPTRRRTSPPSPTASPTSRRSCSPTSRRPASAAPSRAACARATPSSCSRRGRSACARRAGARLMGASLVIGVDTDAGRRAAALRMGADVALDPARGRRRRRGQARHRRRRRRRHRSARPAGDLRAGAAQPAPGRHALEPRRLLGQAAAAVRRVRRRHRRPSHRHDAVPWRQGAHAAAARPSSESGASTPSRSSRTRCRSIASRRRIASSASAATACSRLRCVPEALLRGLLGALFDAEEHATIHHEADRLGHVRSVQAARALAPAGVAHAKATDEATAPRR